MNTELIKTMLKKKDLEPVTVCRVPDTEMDEELLRLALRLAVKDSKDWQRNYFDTLGKPLLTKRQAYKMICEMEE